MTSQIDLLASLSVRDRPSERVGRGKRHGFLGKPENIYLNPSELMPEG